MSFSLTTRIAAGLLIAHLCAEVARGDETAQTINVKELLLTDDPNTLWINAVDGVYRTAIGKSP